MDLPESVAAIGERLGGTGAIVADPQLLHGADVFAAERDRIFLRPWVAVDHQTRLDGDGCYFRFDAATRSLLVILARRMAACMRFAMSVSMLATRSVRTRAARPRG